MNSVEELGGGAPKYADISRLCVSFEAGSGWFCCEEQRPTERLN